MDDDRKILSEMQNSRCLPEWGDYIFNRILALEKQIEQLENEKKISAIEDGNALLKELLSKADTLEKKLDMFFERLPIVSGIGCDIIEDIGSSPEACQKNVKTNSQAQSAAKQKQIAVFIDGENISHKKSKKIIEYANSLGHIEFARVYGVQNNNSDKCWIKTSGELNIKHIRLSGDSKKNKVDKKMFDEILNEAKKTGHVSTIVIATNDADFVPTVKTVKDMGIRVVIMGLKSSLSDKLKKACNSFVYL